MFLMDCLAELELLREKIENGSIIVEVIRIDMVRKFF